jgi:hypothetical protein
MQRFFKWLKKHFIPHKHNDFQPHFLRYESMLFLGLFIVVVELAFLVQIFIVFDKTNFLASVLPGVLTTLTNEKRAQNNAVPLLQNDLLTRAAELKANDMATREYFAHTSPDGKTPWYWLSQVGYKYTMAGENLAVNFFESEDVAEAWMNSPTHRENIVKKGYTEIGIGIANGVYEGRNTTFIAQFFGTPFERISPVTTEQTPKIKIVNYEVVEATTSETPVMVTTTPIETETQILGVETKIVKNETNPIIQSKSFLDKILTSPREYLSYLYGGILIFVVLSIFLVILVRSKMAHKATIARGIALIAIIIILFFVNIKLLHLETILPPEDLSATSIAY